MNDELKATLEWLKECGNNDYIFETGNSRMLLDYITNLQQENQKYKEVIDKLNNKINLLKTCEDKPKEDIIYPHWEICNETKQEMLGILKEVD